MDTGFTSLPGVPRAPGMNCQRETHPEVAAAIVSTGKPNFATFDRLTG
jgi:hypothetical protein